MAAPRTEATRPEPVSASAGLVDTPLYQRVAERLRERIVAHTLAPGSWIDEQALTAELGISRMTLYNRLRQYGMMGQTGELESTLLINTSDGRSAS